MHFEQAAEVIAADAKRRRMAVPKPELLIAVLERAFVATMARDEAVFIRCDLLLIDPDNPDPLAATAYR
jgi:hypothetical protein